MTRFSESKLVGLGRLLLLLAVLIFSAQGYASQPGGFLYVANVGSNTISGYSMDATTGALTPMAGSPFNAGSLPERIAVDPSGKFMYVTNDNPNDQFGLPGTVSGFVIDSATGALTPVQGSPFPAGIFAYQVTVDPTGKFVYVANTGSSGSISAYTIDATTGALTPVPGSPFPNGGQSGGIAAHPNGKFLYVTNQTSTNISAFSIDAGTGALAPIPGSPFPAVAWPNGAAIDPSGKYLYVSNYTGARLSAYTIDATSGALTPIPGSPYLVGDIPFPVAVDPLGKFLYVANAGHPCCDAGTVSAFTIDSGSGALTAVAGSPFAAGINSQGLTVDPSGKFVYVVNSSSSDISAYSIDPSSGALTPLPGSPFSAPGSPLGVVVVQTASQRMTQAIQSLISTIQSFNLKQGITNSFDAKLQNALDALTAANAGSRSDAANQLMAFINSVEAQRGKQLTNAQADTLEAQARQILSLIG